MLRLLCLIFASAFLLSCASKPQPAVTGTTTTKPEGKTGTVKVKVVFDKEGNVVQTTILEATGDLADMPPEALQSVMTPIRRWKVPGRSGTYIQPIRFTLN